MLTEPNPHHINAEQADPDRIRPRPSTDRARPSTDQADPDRIRPTQYRSSRPSTDRARPSTDQADPVRMSPTQIDQANSHHITHLGTCHSHHRADPVHNWPDPVRIQAAHLGSSPLDALGLEKTPWTSNPDQISRLPWTEPTQIRSVAFAV